MSRKHILTCVDTKKMINQQMPQWSVKEFTHICNKGDLLLLISPKRIQ